jgi:hypothetical protein
MSMRDYFAGQALMMEHAEMDLTYEQIAIECYKIADALLRQRLVGQEPEKES